MPILGQCINGNDLSAFRQRHYEDLFRHGHHAPTVSWEPVLPGQLHLPMSVLEFHNEETALIALEISKEWVGVTQEIWWRIMYIHPDLVRTFDFEVGDKLQYIPIGDNEKYEPEPEENLGEEEGE